MKQEGNIVLYDGTFDGMLTAVAYVVKGKYRTSEIYDSCHYLPKLFDNINKPNDLPTDHDQARRLFLFLQDKRDIAAYYALNIYLSEDINAARSCAEMVAKLLQNGRSVLDCYTDETIRYLDKISRKVKGEAHRLNGLIRFRKLKGDVLYAPFEPNYNVLGYCAKHFMGRLSNKKWILHDLKRDTAVFWDTKKIATIQVDEIFTKHVEQEGAISEEWLDKEELGYQELWRTFHNSIANKKRQNRKLQKQRMPVRYWKYLIEKS